MIPTSEDNAVEDDQFHEAWKRTCISQDDQEN
jgi:hypothetical protein